MKTHIRGLFTILFLMSVLFVGCDSFLLENEFTVDASSTDVTQEESDNGADTDSEEPAEPIEQLTVSPTSVSINTGGTTTFSVSGGTPPYDFRVEHSSMGSVDPAGSDSETSFTAGTSAVNGFLYVEDSDGNEVAAMISVQSASAPDPDPPAVVGISPSVVTLGEDETQTFTASGGTEPYTFYVSSANLGSIVTDGAEGAFTAGNDDVQGYVWVEDSGGTRAIAMVSVYTGFEPPDLTLNVQTTEIDRNQTVGLYPTGGTPPYVLTVEQESEANDVHLGSDPRSRGYIRDGKTYIPEEFIGTVTIRVTDSDEVTRTQNIRVNPEPPVDFTAVAETSAIKLSWTYVRPLPPDAEFSYKKSTDGLSYTSANLGVPSAMNNSYSIVDSEPNPNAKRWYKIFVHIPTSIDQFDSLIVGPVGTAAD